MMKAVKFFIFNTSLFQQVLALRPDIALTKGVI